MADQADWALRYAQDHRIDPHGYRSLDAFVSAMEKRRDDAVRLQILEYLALRKPVIPYAETHEVDPAQLSCRDCGVSLREIHATKQRCSAVCTEQEDL